MKYVDCCMMLQICLLVVRRVLACRAVWSPSGALNSILAESQHACLAGFWFSDLLCWTNENEGTKLIVQPHQAIALLDERE
jgi:hypothetical protein